MFQKNIALFASGNGSNAEKFFEHFRNHSSIKVSCLLSNNADAYALTRAKNNQVSTFTFNQREFRDSEVVLHYLQDQGITHIVLAGFMWLVPQYLIQAYPDSIINIHPALLPKYGGKGMYGKHVHDAVIENKEDESGITIHYVNEIYDDGKIIFQGRCKVLPEDNSETLAQCVHQLEYEYYPKVVEAVVLNKKIPVQ